MLAGRSQSSMRNTDVSVLDALRGLAALYVLLFHASILTWENAEHYFDATGHEAGVPLLLLSRVLEFGKPAVLLFFLISGFCIHFRQAKSLAAGHSDSRLFDIRAFAGRRLRRLYPPFLVAIGWTALCDGAGRLLNPSFYAGQTGYWRINLWLYGDHSLPTLLGNVLMQSDLIVPPFGSNGALWSLAYEFWFYAFYPVFLLLTRHCGPRVSMALVTVTGLLVGVVSRLPGHLLPSWVGGVFVCWIIWCAGAFLAEAYVGRVRLTRLALLVPMAAAGLSTLVAWRSILDGTPGLQAVAWGFCLTPLLGYCLLAVPPELRRVTQRASRAFSFLGSISYSLYLMHLPWLTLISAWWLASHDRLPSMWVLFLPSAISSLGLGAVTWLLIERHCTPHGVATERPSVPPRHASGMERVDAQDGALETSGMSTR